MVVRECLEVLSALRQLVGSELLSQLWHGLAMLSLSVSCGVDLKQRQIRLRETENYAIRYDSAYSGNPRLKPNPIRFYRPRIHSESTRIATRNLHQA